MFKLFFAFLLTISFLSPGQDINLKGYFLQDSIKVGEPIHFSLTIRYPRQLDVVFPDSTFNFAPFEFEEKEFFPTKTDSLYSYDSAVYTLFTFEVDSMQYLRLPVFRISDKDSTAYYTATDSVVLQHVVKEIPDPDTVKLENLPLKENPKYLPLALQFNYPYLIIALIVLIIIVLLVLLIFGKKIRRWWKLRRMKKHFQTYKEHYQNIRSDSSLSTEDRARESEWVWKDYMEKLTNIPYTKLTTKEIFILEKNTELQKALAELDKAIYSNKKESISLEKAYDTLEVYSDNKYHQSVEELKHE